LPPVPVIGAPLAEWSYEKNPEGSSGVVQQLPLEGWVETRTDQIQLHFEEVTRNDQFVELHDPNRKVNVRLFPDRLDWKVGDSDWGGGVVGKWTIRPSAEAPPAEPQEKFDFSVEDRTVLLGDGAFE